MLSLACCQISNYGLMLILTTLISRSMTAPLKFGQSASKWGWHTDGVQSSLLRTFFVSQGSLAMVGHVARMKKVGTFFCCYLLPPSMYWAEHCWAGIQKTPCPLWAQEGQESALSGWAASVWPIRGTQWEFVNLVKLNSLCWSTW